MKAYEVVEYTDRKNATDPRAHVRTKVRLNNGKERFANVTLYMGQYFIINPGCALKDHYSDEERDEIAKLNASEPIVDGEIISINGIKFKVKVKGDYSDICDIEEVA